MQDPKTKLQMSIFIATQLLNKPVAADHWQVDDLMKRTKADLKDLVTMANKVKFKRMQMTADLYIQCNKGDYHIKGETNG